MENDGGRREAASSGRAASLPAAGAGRPFERADEIAGDPSTVKVTRLGLHSFLANPRRVDASGIERDVVAQRLVARRWRRVAPGDRVCPILSDQRVEVARFALELTPRQTGIARSQQAEAHVRGRNVDRWRVTGLEHPQRLDRVGQHLARPLNPDPAVTRSDGGRTRIVPHSLHPTTVPPYRRTAAALWHRGAERFNPYATITEMPTPHISQADRRVNRDRGTRWVAILTGVTFVIAGLVKFVFHHWELHAFRSFGLPWPSALEIFAGALEVVGGLLLVLRRAVVPAAALLAATMVVAIIASGIGHGDVIPSLTLAPALLLATLFLLAHALER